MATEHDKLIVDADSFFEIDPITRVIKNTSTKKVKLMQFDHNSERFSFSIPRYVDGHDMSESDRVEVHFSNTDLSTKETSKDRYIIEDLAVNPKNEEEVVFSWLISDKATKYPGTLAFSIRFLCLDGENIIYSWNTEKCKSISVGHGCQCDDEGGVDIDNVDVLEAWKKSVTDALVAHANNTNEEVAHIRSKWAAAIEILFEALSTSAENTKNIVSPGGFAVGYNNDVNKCSLAVGLQNIIKGYRSFGAGQGLNAYGESNRAYFGQFNAKNGQAVLVVGWGTSDSNRKNIFTVDKSGNGVFAGDVKARGKVLATTEDVVAAVKEVYDVLNERSATIIELENKVERLEQEFGNLETNFGDIQNRVIALETKNDEGIELH